jgi:uncharacterized protein (TIGR02001 family)
MKNNIMKGLLFIAVLSLTATTSLAFAEEDSITASADIGAFNEYIWRGYKLNDDSIVVQPSVTLGYKGFSVNGWANLDTGAEDNDAWNETDFTMAYDTGIGPVKLGAGYIYYDLKNADDTREIYLEAGYDTYLSPTITVYRDIDLVPGYYCSFSLSHSIDLPAEIALDLSGSFGYYISKNDSIFEGDTDKRYNGLQDGLFSAGLKIPITKYMTVTPTLSYSFALSDKAKTMLGASSNTFGGIIVSFSF